MTHSARRPGKVALPLAVCFLLASAAAQAAQCPAPESLDQSALAARQALQQAMKTGFSDDADNTVSPALGEAIAHYKQTLAAAFDAHLACAQASPDADALQANLREHLLAPTQPATDGMPEQQDALTVSLSDAPSPLLLVSAGFDIPCGNDNLLLGYRREGDTWVRALDWQSGPYQDISGAYGDLFMVERLPSGDLALMHGTPWCTSRWSHLAVEVIRPATAGQAQRTLLHTEHDYVRDEHEVRLKARPDGFEWRAEVGSLDGDLLTRPGIFRYRQDGETFQRIQPAASNGRGFVDEWLRVDTDLARAWADPAGADATLAARDELIGLDKRTDVTLAYTAVRGCKADPTRFQVDIELDGPQPLAEGNQRYVSIRQESNGFTLLGLSRTADPACSGPDLMPKRG
ncbi:hypothetical protein JVX91_07415 [Pseudomonas sp. PDNC002]|uniref:hypothetical protein n=1 Tax=Pseudomonas sp. PDNC002 TaxID=2811422 RepID=UPI0019668A2E|nr:hypothetical protein [Pseudomonas sp. PDNC002]QRY80925.1 hypothetical protein JVX91_07415 [Pseudomonas sp. PDNC002]